MEETKLNISYQVKNIDADEVGTSGPPVKPSGASDKVSVDPLVQ